MSQTLPPVALTRLGGCVLAGGRGARMEGLDKGLLEIDGETLVARILRQLTPQVSHVMINANRNLERYQNFKVGVVRDQIAGFKGPLAGMHAALSALSESCDAVLFVPCDAPLIAPDLASRLLNALTGKRAALASSQTRLQPTFCLLRVEERSTIESALARGEHRLEAFFSSIDAAVVPFDDEVRCFGNLNERKDLEAHFVHATRHEP